MPDLPTPDVALLRKHVERAEQHPDEHEQRQWGVRWDSLCGEALAAEREQPPECCTAFCIAGQVAHEQGWEPAYWSPDGIASSIWQRGSQRRNVEEVAQEALGLTHREALALFWAENSVAQVRQVAEDIAQRAGTVL